MGAPHPRVLVMLVLSTVCPAPSRSSQHICQMPGWWKRLPGNLGAEFCLVCSYSPPV